MTVAEFHTGLKDKLYELKELLENDKVIYSHGFSAAELQKMLSKCDIPSFIDQKKLERQLKYIIGLSEDGLKKRGLSEEKLLSPIYERAEKHTNPARIMLDGLAHGRSVTD